MIKLSESIIVEGKYDKARLSGIFDANIIVLDGFRIFKDKDTLSLLKTLAQKSGIIIFTDSDGAGFKIRNYLKSTITTGRVIHVYLPDIKGKERRKEKPSAEGFLGVEGVHNDIIIAAFNRAGIFENTIEQIGRKITKSDLVEDKFSGGENSATRRRALLRLLNLPERLSSNSLIDVLNVIMDYDEYKKYSDIINNKLGG